MSDFRAPSAIERGGIPAYAPCWFRIGPRLVSCWCACLSGKRSDVKQ